MYVHKHTDQGGNEGMVLTPQPAISCHVQFITGHGLGTWVQGLGSPALNIHTCICRKAHAVTSTIPPLSVTQGQPSLCVQEMAQGQWIPGRGVTQDIPEALLHFPADLPL